MKKALFVAVLCGMALLPGGTKAAAPKTASMLIHLGGTAFFDAQIHSLLDTFLVEMKKKTGVAITLTLVKSDKAVAAAIKQQQPDFLYVFDQIQFSMPLNLHYRPVIRTTLFDEDSFKGCLYVARNGPQTVAELKGKRLSLLPTEYAYLKVRKMLQERPEVFAGQLLAVKSGQNALYAVAMGQRDGAFVYQFVLPFMKKINPGPLGKIRELVCHPAQSPFPPIFAHQRMDAEFLKRFEQEAVTMHNDPAFAKFHPLLKRFGFHFVAASRQDYEPLFSLVKRARRAGWDKDFQVWMKAAAPKGEE